MEWATQNQMNGKGKLWVFADASYASHFVPLNDATKTATDGAIRILAAGGTKDNTNWNKVSACNLNARTGHFTVRNHASIPDTPPRLPSLHPPSYLSTSLPTFSPPPPHPQPTPLVRRGLQHLHRRRIQTRLPLLLAARRQLLPRHGRQLQPQRRGVRSIRVRRHRGVRHLDM